MRLQLIRYGLVGILSNVVAYLLYLFFTYIGMEPKSAMTVVYLCAAAIGFVCNRKWTFTHRGSYRRAVVRYAAAQAAGYLLDFFALFVFVDILGFSHRIIQAVAILVVATLLFILSKYYVFQSNDQER